MTQSTERFVVLSTAPDAEAAAMLARTLVQERHAACVNVVPGVRSFYRWEGRVHDEAEALLVVKTDRERLAGLIEALAEAHPYDCPEIVALPIADGLPAYLDWISESLATTSEG